MKKVEIKHFCRMPILMLILLLFGVPLCVCFVVFGIAEGNSGLAVIGTVMSGILALGLGFFFNYGVTITPKTVSVIFFNEIRFFKRDEITRIELWIDSDALVGEIKARGQKEYSFVFADFSLDSASLFSRFLFVRVRFSKKRAEKIVSELSEVDRVKIHNNIV